MLVSDSKHLFYKSFFFSTRASWYHDQWRMKLCSVYLSSLTIPAFFDLEANKFLDEQIIFHVGKPPPIGEWCSIFTQAKRRVLYQISCRQN